MKRAFKHDSTMVAATIEDAIQNSLENKITYYHLALFLVMLPFDRLYSQLILVSLLLHTLIHLTKHKLRAVLNKQNLVLSSVFLVTVVGMAWSDDTVQALKDTERQLAILLFPFILSAAGLNIHFYKKKLLIIFGITCVTTVLFLYADALTIILYNKLPLQSLLSPVFINHHFSEPIGMHATYLSMYVALSIASFLYFFIHEKNKLFRFLYATGTAILLSGLLQLASKSVLLATVIILSFGLSFFLAKHTARKRTFMITLAIALGAFVAITRIDAFKKRYVTELKDDLTQVHLNNEISDPRIMRWHCAFALIKQAPIAGHGSGSEKRLLKEEYFDNKLYNSYLYELNAHNQYLSLLIKTGVIGLVVFVIILYAGFVTAWLDRDFIFASFLILVSTVSFSENILDVNKGVFFYAFFVSLFFLTGKNLPGLLQLNKKVSLKKCIRIPFKFRPAKTKDLTR